MIAYRVKKIVTACLFLLFIGLSGWWNIGTNYQAILQQVQEYWETSDTPVADLPEFVTSMNSYLEDNVVEQYSYIEGYGYLQRLLMKREVNNFEIVKDKTENLHYTYFTTGPNEVDVLVRRLGKLNVAAKATGAEMIYLMTPDKFIRGVTEFSKGIPYNYANETADLFLEKLTDYKIDHLDYRSIMTETGELTADSFYQSDHHWTIDMAFSAFQHLANLLTEDYGLELKDYDKLMDLNNYNQITYKDAYLGSMGRKIGQLYTEAEDFTVIYPKFATEFHVYTQSGSTEENVQGRFENTLLNTSILSSNSDKYDAQNDKYFTYMNGNPGVVQITNLANTDGPKVLFIKDSLIVPVASFLSSGTSQTTMIDPRYFHGNIEEILEQGDYDFVFVTYTPQNLTEEFFPFYME